MKAAAKTIFILSVLGVINASYLTYLFIQESYLGSTGTSFCDINSTVSCSNVILSPYAQLFGVPICTIALFVYPALIVLSLLALKKKNPQPYFFSIGILSAMGTMMNFIYVYNEFVFIGAFCLLCIICGVFILTNLILSIVGYAKAPCCVTPEGTCCDAQEQTEIIKSPLKSKKKKTTKRNISK